MEVEGAALGAVLPVQALVTAAAAAAATAAATAGNVSAAGSSAGAVELEVERVLSIGYHGRLTSGATGQGLRLVHFFAQCNRYYLVSCQTLGGFSDESGSG